MRHRVAGRELSRSAAHRKALRRNMAIALFQHGAIRTTEPKAKEIKPFVERLITMARKNTLHARRLISAELGNRRGVRGELYDSKSGEKLEVGLLDKLFGEIAPRYAQRPGGYTRIIRLGERRLGDAGKQVILQLVEQTKATEESAAGVSGRARRAERRAKKAPEGPKPEEK
jgi:large subunit ribosomal protein L17